MEVVDRPYDAAAAEVGMSTEALLAHLREMVERKILRRVAAILYHRRAGFSANGMGVWKVPEERILEVGTRMAAVRGISHCYERPTYADWPYSVFTMAHGRSKEECDAILQSIADEHDLHGADRATLYSSTEFKKIRLHYFTDDYADWEREHGEQRARARVPSSRDDRAPPKPSTPAPSACSRRRQLAGAGDALDRARAPDLRRARRGLRADRRRRQPLRRLGLLLGAADPRPRRPGRRRGGRRGRRARDQLRRADRGRGRARGARSATASPRSRWCGWSTPAPRRR